MDYPLRSLVAARVRPLEEKSGFADREIRIATFDGAAPIGAEAIAGCGVGLDHFAGERVLCAYLLRVTPKGHEHRLALAFTDRRTVLGGWSDIKGNFNGKRFSIAHAELQRVVADKGMMASSLDFFGPAGKHEVPLNSAPGLEMLAGLYQTMLTEVPPAARVEPPTAFPAPADDDPAGARAALQGLWYADPAATRMLELLDRKVRAGEHTPAIAADLVGRVVLAHRSLMGGPGMREGLWVSPMSAADLGDTLVRIYGAPRAHADVQPGVHSVDFEFDPQRDPLFTAIDGLGVASYLVLGVGFSPTGLIGGAIAGALMRKDPVRYLRFVFGDRPGCAGYQIQTPGRVLEDHDAALAHRIHQTLLRLGYAVIERRCATGWG